MTITPKTRRLTAIVEQNDPYVSVMAAVWEQVVRDLTHSTSRTYHETLAWLDSPDFVVWCALSVDLDAEIIRRHLKALAQRWRRGYDTGSAFYR